MVTCLLHSLPPLSHRPLPPATAFGKTEVIHDEKKQQTRTMFSKAAVLVTITSFMDAMVAMLWYEKEIIHPPTRKRTTLPPPAIASVRQTDHNTRGVAGQDAAAAAAAAAVVVAIADGATMTRTAAPTPAPAHQQPPPWSLTHTYVRDMRVNPCELRMLAAEYNMMHDAKITRPLRNRHSLRQRQDNFVWGRRSSLRITSTL